MEIKCFFTLPFKFATITISVNPPKYRRMSDIMTSPLKFLQETYTELKLVIWPNRSEIIRLTLIVITISVFVGIYIGGLDLGFTKLMSFIIK